jgi:hypothetical protein
MSGPSGCSAAACASRDGVAATEAKPMAGRASARAKGAGLEELATGQTGLLHIRFS